VSEDVVSVPALLDFLLDLAARRLVFQERQSAFVTSEAGVSSPTCAANRPHMLRSSTSDLDRSWRSRQYSSIRRASVTTGLPSGVAWSRLLACSLSLTSVLRSAAA